MRNFYFWISFVYVSFIEMNTGSFDSQLFLTLYIVVYLTWLWSQLVSNQSYIYPKA